ncbi:hypothetical protein BCCGELA001_31005 [Bradyrhizobium sp. CCGE-LA001]|nr:hypothetical protein BCCGELA001_31005 [Bradyrhizobium sp. CCGE-LA001]
MSSLATRIKTHVVRELEVGVQYETSETERGTGERYRAACEYASYGRHNLLQSQREWPKRERYEVFPLSYLLRISNALAGTMRPTMSQLDMRAADSYSLTLGEIQAFSS